ncbi:MAG: hypothetical protein LBD06_03035 [Candidatus Accumulibacter sp.]|nr:hypothetical protein [Accumulibacter sp.]
MGGKNHRSVSLSSVQRTVIGEDRRQRSLRRFAPRGREKPSLSFSVFCSEDSDWRGQKTEEFVALCAGWAGKTIAQFPCLLFRGQRLERTEDRRVCGASRRGDDEKPSARFLCLLSPQTSVL